MRLNEPGGGAGGAVSRLYKKEHRIFRGDGSQPTHMIVLEHEHKSTANILLWWWYGCAGLHTFLPLTLTVPITVCIHRHACMSKARSQMRLYRFNQLSNTRGLATGLRDDLRGASMAPSALVDKSCDVSISQLADIAV